MKRTFLAVVLISAVLTIGQGAAPTNALLRNLASRLLTQEWQTIGISLALFECRSYQSGSSAEPLLREALRLNRLSERVLLNIGRVAWLNGECSAAEEAWEQALLLAPHDATAAFLVANARFARGEVEPALAFYRRVRYGDLFYQLGRQVEATQLPREAARWYEMSFSIAPVRKSAQPLSAIYLNVTNEPEEATALWEELQRETSDTDPDHWFAIGQAAEIRRDFAAALRAYENGLQLARNPYEIYLFSSQAALNAERLQNISKARSDYEKALDAQPQLIGSYLALSQLELGQGRHEAALEWLERARGVDPKSELPDYYEGVGAWQRGAKDQALTAFERAHRRNPKNPFPLYYLAIHAHEQHELQQAIANLEEALSNYSGVAIAWLTTLADWYMEAGGCKEAVSTYMRILAWEPESRLFQEQLAELKRACP